MKQFLLLLFLFIGLTANAQYYNTYNSLEAMQRAYEWGKQMAEQQQKQNQGAYYWGYGIGRLSNGAYEEALSAFETAWVDYGYTGALYWLGICNELGIGCERDIEFADLYYEEGCRKNDAACRARVQIINMNGHHPESYRQTFLNNLQANNGGNSYSPSYSGGSYNSGGSNNSSSHRTCPGCNGTGKGPDQITYAPDYTGNSNVYCSTCGRTMSRHSHHQPMCRTCYGKGYIE